MTQSPTSQPSRIVIIGAALAGASAAIALRDQGYQGELTVIGEEGQLPYERPPLSKVVLIVLLWESMRLYANLAISHRALQREQAAESPDLAQHFLSVRGRQQLWKSRFDLIPKVDIYTGFRVSFLLRHFSSGILPAKPGRVKAKQFTGVAKVSGLSETFRPQAFVATSIDPN